MKESNPKRCILCDSIYITFCCGKILELEDKLMVANDWNRREKEGKSERE